MTQFSDDSFFEQIAAKFRANDPEAAAKQRERGHIRCIHLMFHAIARRQFAECLELMTDDVDFEILGPANSPFIGSWRGRAEVLAAMERNFKIVTDQCPTIESLTAQGDLVVLIARETGRLTATDETYSARWAQEFTFDHGRVCRLRELIFSDIP